MASEREIALQRAQQAEKSAALRQRATQSPLGAPKAPRRTRELAPTPQPRPAARTSQPTIPAAPAKSAAQQSAELAELRRQAMGAGTTTTTVPGGLNVTPEQMQRMDQLMNPAPQPVAPQPKTRYIPGVGSITVN